MDTKEIEFMTKSRFETIRSKFSDISPEAAAVIDKAQPDEVLLLDLTFNSPVKVVNAEVCSEERFLELAL
jgi:hypothetical protein